MAPPLAYARWSRVHTVPNNQVLIEILSMCDAPLKAGTRYSGAQPVSQPIARANAIIWTSPTGRIYRTTPGGRAAPVM